MSLDQLVEMIKELFDLSMVSMTLDYSDSEVVVIVSKMREEEIGKTIYTLVVYKNPEADAYFVELLSKSGSILEVTEEFNDIAIAAEQLIGLTNFIDPKYIL